MLYLKQNGQIAALAFGIDQNKFVVYSKLTVESQKCNEYVVSDGDQPEGVAQQPGQKVFGINDAWKQRHN